MARDEVADAVAHIREVMQRRDDWRRADELRSAQVQLRQALEARSHGAGFVAFFITVLPLCFGLAFLQASGAAYLPPFASFIVYGSFIAVAGGVAHLAQQRRLASLTAMHARWLELTVDVRISENFS
jgi:hypothetical protein